MEVKKGKVLLYFSSNKGKTEETLQRSKNLYIVLQVHEDPIKISTLTNFALLRCLYWNLEMCLHTCRPIRRPLAVLELWKHAVIDVQKRMKYAWVCLSTVLCNLNWEEALTWMKAYKQFSKLTGNSLLVNTARKALNNLLS